jgi:hypothetical protein
MKRITKVGYHQTIEEGVAPLNQLRLQTLWFFMGCSLVMLV